MKLSNLNDPIAYLVAIAYAICITIAIFTVHNNFMAVIIATGFVCWIAVIVRGDKNNL